MNLADLNRKIVLARDAAAATEGQGNTKLARLIRELQMRHEDEKQSILDEIERETEQ